MAKTVYDVEKAELMFSSNLWEEVRDILIL